MKHTGMSLIENEFELSEYDTENTQFVGLEVCAVGK
jgi:hypothetical protein